MKKWHFDKTLQSKAVFITKSVSCYKLRQNLAILLEGEVISTKRDIETISFLYHHKYFRYFFSADELLLRKPFNPFSPVSHFYTPWKR